MFHQGVSIEIGVSLKRSAIVAGRSLESFNSSIKPANSEVCWPSSAVTVLSDQTNIPAFQAKLPWRRNCSANSGLGFSRKRETSNGSWVVSKSSDAGSPRSM